MKISKSKQELARIISENGGWRDGAKWATQDHVIAFFSGGKPYYAVDYKVWRANGDDGVFIVAMSAGDKINGFNNTILSRAEYFHLYPAPDADGWIEFDATERPSGYFNKMIDVKLKDGRELTASSGRFVWDTDGPSRIIAYRPHKPEQSTVESRLADAVDIVKSAAPALMRDDMKFTGDEVMGERKPTIEQLTADYRNAKDYAERKQQEADSAKADAEAKLADLIAAGNALGLVLRAEREGGAATPIHSPLIAGD